MPTPRNANLSQRFEKRLPPDWDAAKSTWDGCIEFLREQGVDQDTAYAVAMSAQELLENAVKYGRFDSRTARIDFAIEVNPREVTVEVRAPATHDAQRLRKLDDTVQWIRGFQDPFEAYVERLKHVSARPYTPGESGLGLARVAYEGQCILDFYVDEHDTLAMSAVRHLPRPHA